MKKITITNAYTWYNKGDAGILLGIVETLKHLYGEDNVEINVLSFTPKGDKKRYCQDKCIKQVESNILNPFPFKHTKLGKIIAIIRLIFRMIYLKLMMAISMKSLIKKEKSLELLNNSDIIIVCGGGFLGGKKFDSLMHLFQINVNTKFNKPVIVMGTSIEPIKNKIIKYFTEKELKKVDYVYARETITYNYLESFLPEEKYTIIPDMAFMLSDKKEQSKLVEKIKKENKILVGITVRKWNFPNISTSQDDAMNNYISSLVKLMENQVEERKAAFVFIPQVIVEHASDTAVAKEIKSRLEKKYQEKFLILEDDLSPLEIKSLIGNCDYFIGTRMHSNIFATSMKVPTMAIAYEKKTNGIMETVNMQQYIVEMDTITYEELKEKFNNLILNSNRINQELEKNIKNIRKEITKKINSIMINK